MNQMLRQEQIEAICQPLMTRRERLYRWAQLVSNTQETLEFYHRLEYVRPDILRTHLVYGVRSAFCVAANNPAFQQEGLTVSGNPKATTFGDIMRFFGVTQDDLHEFSCDCSGGPIDNWEIAKRIASLAHR